MAKPVGYKRILDSVHGYVHVPEYYADNIIDTIQFQRLRRIEQTSCRALFPSARHDRFIHSIGVFHLGTLIAEELWKKCADKHLPRTERTFIDEKKASKIIITYRLACLLHDVGHTPFSHTFEDYFINESNELPETLAKLIPEDNNFLEDFWYTYNDDSLYAAHEVISAIVAVKYFGQIIQSKRNKWKNYKTSGNLALLARMIVGCYYRQGGDKTASLENAFIELIHGEIIDADGLDYVCRDVWASGYSTSKVDVSRLIDAIMIYRKDNNYTVCYDVKAINEIRSVLQVKNFQSDFVINHHSVLLEQEMLKRAMQTAAIYHMKVKKNEDEDDDSFRMRALMKLCNIKMYSSKGFRTKTGIKITWPMDDDFVSLMKYCANDVYVSQWLSRKYNVVPLWKTKESFLADLPINGKMEIADSHSWIFNKSKDYIIKKFNLKQEYVVFVKFNYKDRLEKLPNINLYINSNIEKYETIYKIPKKHEEAETGEPMKILEQQPAYAMDFQYIFLPLVDVTNTKHDIEEYKKALIQEAGLRHKDKEFQDSLLVIIDALRKYVNKDM